MTTDSTDIPTLSFAGNSLCTDGRRIRHVDCHQCVIRKKMLFAELDLPALDNLLESINNLLLNPGVPLYRQGDPGTALFSVRKGLVKLTQTTPEGYERVVHIAGPGSCIGMEGFLHSNYKQSASAITEVDTCAVPVDVAQKIADEQPVLYHALLERWQLQFELAERWMLELAHGTVRQRLARMLLMLDEIGHTHGQIRLLNNNDSASILATTVETVSRNIAAFKREGAIQKEAPSIYSLNKVLLERYAEPTAG